MIVWWWRRRHVLSLLWRRSNWLLLLSLWLVGRNLCFWIRLSWNLFLWMWWWWWGRRVIRFFWISYSILTPIVCIRRKSWIIGGLFDSSWRRRWNFSLWLLIFPSREYLFSLLIIHISWWRKSLFGCGFLLNFFLCHNRKVDRLPRDSPFKLLQLFSGMDEQIHIFGWCCGIVVRKKCICYHSFVLFNADKSNLFHYHLELSIIWKADSQTLRNWDQPSAVFNRN